MVVENVAVSVGKAERSEIARLKRFDPIGRVLGDVATTENGIVHDHKTAPPSRLRVGSHAHGIQHVQIPVGAQSRRRSHGAHKHDGLVGLESEIEEVGRLFQRVGAVGNDDAVGLIVGKDGFDLSNQFQPILVHERVTMQTPERGLGHLGNSVELGKPSK